MLRVAAWTAARGDWVHVFPEGKIQVSGKLGAFKWGVGKMVGVVPCIKWCGLSW